MKFKFINFVLNVSIQEASEDENGIKQWHIDSGIDKELGTNGTFFPDYNEFQLNPNTYNILDLNPDEVYSITDKGLILMLAFIENTGNNDCLIGYKSHSSSDNIFPIKLGKKECLYLRGTDTTIMSQLLIKSTLGSSIKFLFTSDGTFKRVNDSNGNIIRDSLNREVVAFL